ncbi:N-acetylneuraminate synthase [Chromobacterium phragmitis]|uniref:N-acetylneuraminate synthase n=1 Tax=Chromobacterium phragmitis TaxID=2202141 RepID=A0A344UH48_9NEIS|nr:N-acetylneuraminate synthase family protein [Chromobacterium phragmitis]AXE29237.1 N-acetylneuraminate synthase [Chromobacterium phragmitis]AXE34596.1 N-acetylneuraminate synthase [Chromobacterium phragmitis]
MTVYFGKRAVGDGHPCFITYEAGPTHDSLASAKQLVKLAAEAGADAVKFQIFDADKLCADKQQLFSYEVLVDKASGRMETVEEPLYQILRRRCLEREEWRELKAYCDSLGLAFFSTVSFEEDIRLLEELGCASIKIASADVNHFPLLRQAARTGMCVQLDTGNATLGEIEAAVDVIRAEGNESIIIHQCPSGYPARLNSINLNIIATLKKMFPYPVAFSDHTPGWDMDVAALALGANLLEKTITMDRCTRSVEHVFSLEPQEMAAFIHAIRDVETALGSHRRILHPEEMEKRKRIRRSVFLAQPARAGQRLSELAVDFRRPGHGIGPDQYEGLRERVLARDLPAGHLLAWDDLQHG